MLKLETPLPIKNKIKDHANNIFYRQQKMVYKRTDKLFAGLIALEWLGAIITALWISPRAWSGTFSEVHIHVWAAIILGGIIASFPIYMALLHPGRTITRHVIAVGQILLSALLIHLTGGRIETHFHVFGSLAFLAFYRDWRVLITASLVVALDHGLRGVFWPQSVYGVLTVEPWRWVEHTWWVIFEDIFLIISINQSLKEMKKIAERQAELEDTNLLIEAKVIERTHQLQAEIKQRIKAEEEAESARDAAIHANQLKSQFVANISHEIRTPMSAVIGLAELVAQAPELSDDTRKMANSTFTSSNHLLSILNDLLDFSKLEANRMHVDKSKFSIPTILDDVRILVEPLINEKKLELTITSDPNIPKFLFGDDGKTRQILLNIANNACKFTQAGGIKIAADLESNTNKIATVLFSVTDTGIGIAEHIQSTLFQPFVQADTTIKRNFGGTGLGLSISKRLVELLGGKMGFSSKQNEGSTFWFTLSFDLESRP
jgi:signal transduction histidine kinase